MNGLPTAARGFPWRSHRTVAEIETDLAQIEQLDRVSRQRSLTYQESLRLERLIYGSKAA